MLKYGWLISDCQRKQNLWFLFLDSNPSRSLFIYVPLTTQNRHSPYEIEILALPFLERTSIVNVQDLASLPIVHLEKKIGMLPDSIMQDIKKTLS